MKEFKIYAIISLLFIAIGIFIGYNLKKEKIIAEKEIINIETNIDSLKNIWLTGKIDTFKFIEQIKINHNLMNAINKLKMIKPETVMTKNNILMASIDTSIKSSITSKIIFSNDTINIDTSTMIQTKINYLPDYNLFNIDKLNIEPITFNIRLPTTKILIDTKSKYNISGVLVSMGRYNVGIGAIFDIDHFKFGYISIYKTSPIWLVGYNILGR